MIFCHFVAFYPFLSGQPQIKPSPACRYSCTTSETLQQRARESSCGSTRQHVRPTTKLTGRCPSASPESPTSNQRGHCFYIVASARANLSLWVVRPALVAQFAAANLWSCLCDIVNVAPDQCRRCCHASLCLGGLGLRSASRTSTPAYWASWADSLHMISPTAPRGCGPICGRSGRWCSDSALGSAVDAARHLLGVEGFVPPSWTELSLGARPPPREVEDFELAANCTRRKCHPNKRKPALQEATAAERLSALRVAPMRTTRA